MNARTVEFEAADGYTYTAELGDRQQQWWNIYDSDGQPQTSCYITSINTEHGFHDPFDTEVREQCSEELAAMQANQADWDAEFASFLRSRA